MQTVKLLPLLLSGALCFAETTGTSDCSLTSSEDYMRVGDLDSKEIFTRTDYLYDCNTTTIKKGPCETWDTQHEEYNASYRQDVTFKSDNFDGSVAELFNLVSAYNGVQYIWGGWKGICSDGTLTDFTWAQDPLYWASLALQAVGDLGYLPEGDLTQYGLCAAQAALGAGDALLDYNDDSKIPCDTIDEFCEEGDEESPDNIISIDEQNWNDAIAGNPKLADYTEIVSQENGIVTVKFSPQDTSNMTAAEKEGADKEAKELMLKFQSILIGVNVAICIGSTLTTGKATATSSVASNASLTSGATILTTAVGAFNPIAGAILTVAIDLATSFNDVDTCNKKKDAEEQGSRHLKTFTHKAYHMCHEIRVEQDIESSPFTKYDNHHFCCYPDVIARTLSEQIKAQLGRSWTHCTDITFQDLESVDFKSCTPSQIASGADGKIIRWDASFSERTGAFQYTNKCIDYTDLNTYIKNQIGGIDNFNFEEQIKGIEKNNFIGELNVTQ